MSLADLIRNARLMTPATTAAEPLELDKPQDPPPHDDSSLAAPSPSPAAPVLHLVDQSTVAEAMVDKPDIAFEKHADGLVFPFGDRRYRIRGFEKNTSWEHMQVNVKATRASDDSVFHQHSFDFFDGEKRAKFIKLAAVELGIEEAIVKKDLARVLRKLEELQREQIEQTLAPREQEVTLTPAEEAEAMELLTAPNLIERIQESFRRLGIVGEETNLLVTFLVVISRLLKKPLGVIVQSSSAAGKTTLLDAVLACTPAESFLRYSALTAQALFYLADVDLKHKVLCVREEKGARGATEPLKLLLSDGELTIASTGKDTATGKLMAHEYHREGPVALLTTSTAVDVDEELQNRCITLAVDESREQTQKIHEQQRYERTLEGIWECEERPTIRKLLQNAQRLLKPLTVFNPFADKLGFVDKQTRTRRDHLKYLTLMDAIALLHQHQRPRQVLQRNGKSLECVVVTREDVTLANRLASEVLGRFLDELSPQTRNLLLQIHRMVDENAKRLKVDRQDYRFSRKDVRQYSGWSDFQVKMHMKKLEELEYVLVHHGKRGQSFVYELLWAGEGQDGQRFMMRLIDPSESYTQKKEHLPANKEHRNGEKEHSSSPQVAIKEHPSRSGQNGSEPFSHNVFSDSEPEIVEKAHIGDNGTGRHSRSRLSILAAAPGDAEDEE